MSWLRFLILLSLAAIPTAFLCCGKVLAGIGTAGSGLLAVLHMLMVRR
jgi:hypothetical protein